MSALFPAATIAVLGDHAWERAEAWPVSRDGMCSVIMDRHRVGHTAARETAADLTAREPSLRCSNRAADGDGGYDLTDWLAERAINRL